MGSAYLLFIVLFIVNNLLHQVSEKIVIILFILLIYVLYISFKGLITLNYTQRITALLRESHLYIDSLFLLAYLLMYLTLRVSYATNEANAHLFDIHNQLSKFNSLANFVRSHLSKTPFLLSSVILVPNYSTYL